MTKDDLRKRCLDARKSLSFAERSFYSAIICKTLETLSLSERIMSYCPIREEVDVSAFNEKYHPAFPVTMKDRMMEAYRPGTFVISKLGIKEPDPETSSLIDPAELDAIIIPCVGFDLKGYRLGYGGGYYDTYLKRTAAKRIGVAFSIQETQIPLFEEHDEPLDLIVTEKGIIELKK